MPCLRSLNLGQALLAWVWDHQFGSISMTKTENNRNESRPPLSHWIGRQTLTFCAKGQHPLSSTSTHDFGFQVNPQLDFEANFVDTSGAGSWPNISRSNPDFPETMAICADKVKAAEASCFIELSTSALASTCDKLRSVREWNLDRFFVGVCVCENC